MLLVLFIVEYKAIKRMCTQYLTAYYRLKYFVLFATGILSPDYCNW